MAVFTGSPTSASPYSAQSDGYTKAAGLLAGGEVRRAHISYTHTVGAGTGEVNLVTLPAGRIKVWSNSFLITTDFEAAASGTMDVGYRAYVSRDGTPVEEDDNAFVNDFDVETGGKVDFTTLLDTAANGGCLTFDSLTGITLFASLDTGNIEDTDTITGTIYYSVE